MIDPTRRRLLLAGGAVTALGAASPFAWRMAANARRPAYFSAYDDDRGRHHIAALTADGAVARDAVVPVRAHSVAVAPDGAAAVFFARRPGRLAWRLDLSGDRAPRTIHAASGRHFYGHGCFSADGRLLYTTENDYAAGRGVVVVRDVVADRIVDEFPSHGMGPHDVRLMPDGRTLVVANGGIRTHPDRPREKLNLDTMQPNLAYLRRTSGELLERIAPPDHQLSVRHLWVAPDARVGVAMQYQGNVADRVPLVAFHRRGEPLRTALAPLAEQRRVRGYTASICIDGDTAAVTCPRGDRVTLWNARTGELVGARRVVDAGGVNLAPDGNGFLITTGGGRVLQLPKDARRRALVSSEARQWDNHLVSARG